MPIVANDIRRLVKFLGPEGAVAGLLASHVSDAELREALSTVTERPVVIESPDTESGDRTQLCRALVAAYTPSPKLKIDDLMKMSYEEIREYFIKSDTNNDDLLKFMKDLNYKVSSTDRKNLRNFVARQISETSLFSRVASKRED